MQTLQKVEQECTDEKLRDEDFIAQKRVDLRSDIPAQYNRERPHNSNNSGFLNHINFGKVEDKPGDDDSIDGFYCRKCQNWECDTWKQPDCQEGYGRWLGLDVGLGLGLGLGV